MDVIKVTNERLVPTRVGMILTQAQFEQLKQPCPHTRGDDPKCFR